MHVETYEVTEKTTEARDGFETDTEAMALIEELGLEGQKELYSPECDDDVATRTRVPYRKMNAEEQRVYGTLFPTKTDVARYNSSPIPLRVLQVAAHARSLFDRVQVWHPEEHPDPILVGANGHEYTQEPFLLARWGEDALLPYSELREAAIQRIEEKWVAKADECIAKCGAFKASPRSQVLTYIGGGFVSGPWT